MLQNMSSSLAIVIVKVAVKGKKVGDPWIGMKV